MLKVIDIKNITFSKSMNGYKATEVNAFIDECAKTVASLVKEKEDLEKKLEILADRLVEYRDDEDSIRAALLGAQKLGDTTVREANHKAGLILEDAQSKAESISKEANDNAENLINEADEYAAQIKNDARNSIIGEEETFDTLKTNVSDFKIEIIALYKNHLELINKIPEYEKQADPEPEIEETSAEGELVEVEDEQIHKEEESAKTTEVEDSEVEIEDEVADVDDTESAMDKVRVNTVFAHSEEKSEEKDESGEKFDNLKFGEDYDIKEDEDDNGKDAGGFFRRRK